MLYPEFDPVAVTLGPLKVHWYGISYLFAFVVGWLLARYRAARLGNWSDKQVEDMLFYLVLGVILGGRLGYILFYNFDQWLADPLRLFRVWEGGMSFHGGLIGVLVAMLLLARKQQRGFFEVTDFIAPLIPVGLFSGRLGNFINGELWGGVTDLPWGMQVSCQSFAHLCYEKLNLPAGADVTPPLHPSQLYEASLEGLVLLAILWLYAAFKPPRMAISGAFLLFYGLFRSLVELVRMPDAHIGYLWADWLTMGQLLSLPMIIAGLVLLAIAYGRNMKKPTEQEL
jgi:phosphatidylglycerol:prolipoprotein diacylglycerol transferase